MSKISLSARGEDCTLRIPGVCNWDTESTILAHLRRGWNCGTGMKPHDDDAVYACSACHDAIGDGSRRRLERLGLEGAVIDALLRTRLRRREMAGS